LLSYWENQKRKAEKRSEKLLIKIEEIEKKIAKLTKQKE